MIIARPHSFVKASGGVAFFAGMGYTEDKLRRKERTIMSVIHITKENFDQEVIRSEAPVLLDFWASWCGPCRMVAPIVEEIAEEYPQIKVGKVDVDSQMELAARFGIASIPTLLVLEKGQVIRKAIGYRPKAEILAMLEL